MVRRRQFFPGGKNRRDPARGDEPYFEHATWQPGEGMNHAPSAASVNLPQKNGYFRWCVLVLSALFFVHAAPCRLAAAPGPQENKFPNAREIVKPSVIAPSAPVKRGSPFTIAVKLEIRPGFHIQANTVLEDYLIPTTLDAELPKGLKLAGTSYPKSKLVKFPFNSKQMAVY